jgi:hypothetical protein
MLEEDLTDALVPGLTAPHILQRGIEPLVRLYQLLNVANQLVVLGILQAVQEKSPHHMKHINLLAQG